MKKFFLAALFSAAVLLSISAETVPFRSGELLAAELSTVRPKINNFDKFAYPETFEKPIYAVLVVRLAPGRTLSNYDYSIDAFGVTSPCIAIKAGNGDFDSGRREIREVKKGEKYSLLFLLNGSLVGLTPQEKLILKCNFPPAERAEQTIFLNNLGSRPFTAPGRIPDAGIMKVN